MAKKDEKSKNMPGGLETGGYLVIITAVLTLLIFSTVNTTAFITPKSFLLRFMAFAIAVYHVATNGFKIKNHPVNFALFCYFLSVFFSVFSSVNPLTGILRLSEYLSYFLIFLFAFNYFDNRNIGKLVSALTLSAVPIVLYGVLQYMQIDFSFWEKPEGRMDLFSTLGNVNWYALYLAAITPLITYAAFRGGAGSREKYGYGALLFFAISSLIISYSRTAVVASAVSVLFGLALYFALNKLKPSKTFITRAAAIGVVCISVAALFSFYNPVSKTRFAEGGFLSRMRAGFSLGEHNVAQRLFIWRIALEMYSLKPVLGLGPGSFKIKYLEHQKDFLKRSADPEAFDDLAGNAKEAHNDYIQMLVECGTAGLAAMLYFFFVIYKNGISFLFSEPPAEAGGAGDKFLALALMVSLTAYLTGALADFPFHVPPNAMLIFLLAAMILIVSRPASRAAGADEFVEPAVSRSGEPAQLYSLKMAFYVFMFIVITFLAVLPYAADCLAVVGQNYLKEHNFEAAVPYLTRSVALNPAQGDALYLLGTAYVGMAAPANAKADNGLLERGRDLLIRSKNYTTDKGIYNNLGFIAIRKQQYDEAINYFENAIGCDPKSADSLNNLGIVYFHKKVYDRAEYFYNKALKMNPYFLTAVNNLGDLYTRMNNFDRAIEFYSRTIDSSVEIVIAENQRRNVFNFTPASCLSEKARANYQIGEIHGGRGGHETALKYYMAAYENIRTMPQIPLKIALMNFKLGRKEEGRAYADSVLKNTPQGSEYNRQAAEILSKYAN
jgi:tetratricopeptide (TPR) repeat protein